MRSSSEYEKIAVRQTNTHEKKYDWMIGKTASKNQMFFCSYQTCVGATSRTKGTTTKICPPLLISAVIAFRMTISFSSDTDTLTSLRPRGAVFIRLKSRRFAILICNVRGIGVAESVSTSVPPDTA